MNSRSSGWRRALLSLTAIYWLAIFVLTHLPPAELPKTNVSDKLAHFVVYALLGLLLSACLPRRWPVLHRLVVAISIGMVYGAFDELTQPIVARFCSLDDWLADAAGAATGAFLGSLARLAAPKGRISPNSP